jgi:hypothetical protein
MYASAKCVDDELGYTDQNGSYTLVSNAQDLLSIAHNNQVDVFWTAPLLNVILDTIHIVDVEKATFRSPEDLGVISNRLAFCGSVDDGEHLLQVIEDKLLVVSTGAEGAAHDLVLCNIAPRFAPSCLS